MYVYVFLQCTLVSADQCKWWQEFYNATMGWQWANCKDSSIDPCSCGAVSCQHGEVTSIALTGSNLNGSIPSEGIASLTSLTTLDLQVNHLTGTIPASLGVLAQLTVIGVRCNDLSGAVPNLPFEQYTTGCWIGGSTFNCGTEYNNNHFSCPVPKDSDKCRNLPPTCI